MGELQVSMASASSGRTLNTPHSSLASINFHGKTYSFNRIRIDDHVVWTDLSVALQCSDRPMIIWEPRLQALCPSARPLALLAPADVPLLPECCRQDRLLRLQHLPQPDP